MNYDDLSKSIVALITIVVDGMYQEEKKNYTKDFPNSGAWGVVFMELADRTENVNLHVNVSPRFCLFSVQLALGCWVWSFYNII